MNKTLMLAPALLAAGAAGADGDLSIDVAALEQRVAAMAADYEQRISDLEQRLAAAEARARTAESDAAEALEMAEDVAYAPQPTASRSANTFNPGIGAVLIGTYADTGQGEEIDIPGFQIGGEPAPGDGFSIGESEFNFNAAIDDKFFGNLTFALADEEGSIEVELEEAWIQTLALPAHLQLTAGRQFSGVGYLNGFHLHADDFIDRPLPYRAFLGGQYGDDGLQLRWLAPTPWYLELGSEIMRGDKFPGGAETDGKGIWTAFVKTGGDIGLSHSWKAGFSYLSAEAAGRTGGHGHGEEAARSDDHGHAEDEEGFFGDSDLWALEAIYKWSPDGNATVRNVVLQGEYFSRDESGEFDSVDYDGEQTGWYLQGLYQFRPGWRVGYRRDALDADNRGVGETELADLGFEPRRDSLILEWQNSEFSRARLQYIRDRSTLDEDDQLYLQYIMSIGAHRAHQF